MAFSLVWQDNSVNTADAQNYTFTSQALGAVADAGETRYEVVAVAFVDATTWSGIDTATIGGVAATTDLAFVHGGSSLNPQTDIIIAAVPTGTTGSVVVNTFTTEDGMGIDVFRMIDPLSATPHATATDITPTSGVLNLNVNIPTGGGAVGVVQSDTAGTTTWSGLSEVSDIDIMGTGGDERMSGASGTTAGTPVTITATNSDTTPGGYVGSVASWVPGGIPVGQALL